MLIDIRPVLLGRSACSSKRGARSVLRDRVVYVDRYAERLISD